MAYWEAYWLNQLRQSGYTQICVAGGSVSWGSEDNAAAGELQLWCREGHNNYCLYARNRAGDAMPEIGRASCRERV